MTLLPVINRSSFRVPVYRWYWAGNVLVHITYLLQAVALGWHMLEVTGSPLQVGLVASAYGLAAANWQRPSRARWRTASSGNG